MFKEMRTEQVQQYALYSSIMWHLVRKHQSLVACEHSEFLDCHPHHSCCLSCGKPNSCSDKTFFFVINFLLEAYHHVLITNSFLILHAWACFDRARTWISSGSKSNFMFLHLILVCILFFSFPMYN